MALRKQREWQKQRERRSYLPETQKLGLREVDKVVFFFRERRSVSEREREGIGVGDVCWEGFIGKCSRATRDMNADG